MRLTNKFRSNKRDAAIQKFGQLTGAYTTLQKENEFLRNAIKKQLEEINKKLDIDALATALANSLKPELDSSKVNYDTVKQKCKEALDETQDFLDNIPADVDSLLKAYPATPST
jgi:seryl-tRNA synthetase